MKILDYQNSKVGQGQKDLTGDDDRRKHVPKGQELHLLRGGEGGLPHVQEPAGFQPGLL